MNAEPDRRFKFAAHLAGGAASVYLLHGDETFLSRRAVRWLRDAVLKGIAEDFNLDRFDAQERPDIEGIVGAARTLPMMAERRLVWVTNAQGLFVGRKLAGIDRLMAYIKAPDPSSCLVLHAMGRVSGRTALYKTLSEHARIYEAVAPYERELMGWAQAGARARNRTLEPDAATFLVETVGRNLHALEAALEHLSLFVDPGRPIELSHVEDAIAHTRAHTVWELVDAVADRSFSRALAQAHRLIGQGESELRLLGMIARQLRQLIVGRAAKAAGKSPQEVATLAGVRSFNRAAFIRQLDSYRGDELLRAVNRVAEADRALKSSRLPSKLIFEGALMDLCAPSASR